MDAMGQEERRVSFEQLKKFGMKWAVLAAMRLDVGSQGISVPADMDARLKLARMKILSGCFSPCEVGCDLSKIEAQLVSVGADLGEHYLRPWFELLGQAMQGILDPARIDDIPALKPVATDCRYLACHCG
ncbi:MAG: hypothetical protein EHM91_16095 [Planctomycetota bacterium]|nr:MAG: hypothetical protein EHM91_16095 [Planctomycetota bacterium]